MSSDEVRADEIDDTEGHRFAFRESNAELEGLEAPAGRPAISDAEDTEGHRIAP